MPFGVKYPGEPEEPKKPENKESGAFDDTIDGALKSAFDTIVEMGKLEENAALEDDAAATGGQKSPFMAALTALAAGTVAAADPDTFRKLTDPLLMEKKLAKQSGNTKALGAADRRLRTLTNLINVGSQIENRRRSREQEDERIRLRDEAQTETARKNQEAEGLKKDQQGARNTFIEGFKARIGGLEQQAAVAAEVLAARKDGQSKIVLARLNGALEGYKSMVAAAEGTEPNDATLKLIEASANEVDSALGQAAALTGQAERQEARQQWMDKRGRLVPASQVARLTDYRDIRDAAEKLLAPFRDASGQYTDMPGNFFNALFGGAPLTEEQIKFAADLQAAVAKLRHKIFGSALTETEKKNALQYLPTFGGSMLHPDATIISGFETIISEMESGRANALDDLAAAGYTINRLDPLGGLMSESLTPALPDDPNSPTLPQGFDLVSVVPRYSGGGVTSSDFVRDHLGSQLAEDQQRQMRQAMRGGQATGYDAPEDIEQDAVRQPTPPRFTKNTPEYIKTGKMLHDAFRADPSFAHLTPGSADRLAQLPEDSRARFLELVKLAKGAGMRVIFEPVFPKFALRGGSVVKQATTTQMVTLSFLDPSGSRDRSDDMPWADLDGLAVSLGLAKGPERGQYLWPSAGGK